MPDQPAVTAPEQKAGLLGKVLRLVAGIGLGGGLLYLTFRDGDLDLEQMKRVFLDVRVVPLLGLLVLTGLAVVLRGVRQRCLLGVPVSVHFTTASACLGYAVNAVLPRVGEVVRVVHLNRRTRIPVALIAATVLIERMIEVFVLGVLVLVSLFVFTPVEADQLSAGLVEEAQSFGASGGDFAIDLSDMRTAALALLAGLTVVAVMLVLFALRPTTTKRWLGPLLNRLPAGLRDRLETALAEFSAGILVLRSQPLQALIAAVLSLLIWVCWFFTFERGCAAFGLDELSLRAVFLVYTFTTIGMLFPTPGGIGAFHYFGKVCLVYALGVPVDQALAGITAIHLSIQIIGGPSLFYLMFLTQVGRAPQDLSAESAALAAR
jgi:uncharacterized membrane protein YbhN (UPF0104 family)